MQNKGRRPRPIALFKRLACHAEPGPRRRMTATLLPSAITCPAMSTIPAMPCKHRHSRGGFTSPMCRPAVMSCSSRHRARCPIVRAFRAMKISKSMCGCCLPCCRRRRTWRPSPGGRLTTSCAPTARICRGGASLPLHCVDVRGLVHYGDAKTLRYAEAKHRMEQLQAAYDMACASSASSCPPCMWT